MYQEKYKMLHCKLATSLAMTKANAPIRDVEEIKHFRNIWWILLVAAQESGTHPLDFTETTRRRELTSASANLNRGVSRGFNPFLSFAVEWPYIEYCEFVTLVIDRQKREIMCGKRDRLDERIYLSHSLTLWMNELNECIGNSCPNLFHMPT